MINVLILISFTYGHLPQLAIIAITLIILHPPHSQRSIVEASVSFTHFTKELIICSNGMASQLIQLAIVMWSISKTSLLLLLLLVLGSASYLQFQLIRTPVQGAKGDIAPIVCKDEASINQEAEYKEVCYEKDISYNIPFIKENQHVLFAADLTAPLSWIKGPDCIVEGSSQKCKHIQETLTEQVKKKFKKSNAKAEKQDAIIAGSSQIIRGEFQQAKQINFTTRDSSRLNNFFELIMLGLFVYGEKDTINLTSTNFISATSISPNLQRLMDGAISMRFDSTSENSFLNEIFTYVKAAEKTICIYLGENKTLTIGDMTAKYTHSGFSSINWINLPDDEGFGKMLQVSDIGIEDSKEDSEETTDETIPALVTLSASYIGLPEKVLQDVLIKSFSKLATCKIDNHTFYAECSSTNKKNLEKIIGKNLFFGFGGPNLMVPMKDLVLRNDHGKRIIFNIKKTFNNRIILGEPIYNQNVVILDYTKNKIGIAPKRVSFNEFFINVVTLVRFLCLIFVFGCSFIICYQPCRKFLRALGSRQFFAKGTGQQGKRLRQYSPIQQNPYDDLKGKIQDAISSTEKEVQGI